MQIFFCPGCQHWKEYSQAVRGLTQVVFIPQEQIYPQVKNPINWIQTSMPVLLCAMCAPVGSEV